MKLHLDKEVFKQFVNKISIETNITMDILEKDYYVCCILQELSKKQEELQAYFKGGTAIYKILDTMNRFSEDIDLTVKVNEELSNTQKKKLFERTAFDYDVKGLILNKEKSIKYGKSETAFYNYANDDEKKILRENFEVEPIKMKIIKLERMFIDKVFAAEFYYIREQYTDASKHIYDLCVLISNDKIEKLFNNEQELRRLVGYKRKEESVRTNGIMENIKIKDFSYLKCNFNNEFINKFENMQDKYIINDKYKIDMNKIKNILKNIKERFNGIDI